MLGNMFGTLDKYVVVSMCGCACFCVLCVMNLELFWNIGARKGASSMEHPSVWLCVMNLELFWNFCIELFYATTTLSLCVLKYVCPCDVCISEQKKWPTTAVRLCDVCIRLLSGYRPFSLNIRSYVFVFVCPYIPQPFSLQPFPLPLPFLVKKIW
jgi:hypothetical protein